jgi:hypothetical protein
MLLAEVYLLGVVIGLIATDGSLSARIALALAWPLGPLAFVITIAGLTLAAAIAFPAFGALLSVVLAGVWWLLRTS